MEGKEMDQYHLAKLLFSQIKVNHETHRYLLTLLRRVDPELKDKELADGLEKVLDEHQKMIDAYKAAMEGDKK